MTEIVCPECDGKGKILDAPADVLNGEPYWTTCPECLGTGKVDPNAGRFDANDRMEE